MRPLTAIALLLALTACSPQPEPMRAQPGSISRESALWIAGQISSYLPGISPEIPQASLSMEPTFGANSVTLWRQFDRFRETLRPGHIVQIYRQGQPRLVHRVVGFDRSGRVLTKGDNPLAVLDPPHDLSAVTHVYVGQLQFDPSI